MPVTMHPMLRIWFLLTALVLAACQSGPGLGPAVPTAARSTAARSAVVPLSRPVNWPQFRFDDPRTGVNPLETVLTRKNVPRLQLLWAAELGALVDYSSPAIVNGVVYIASTDGRLWAYPSDGCGTSLCTSPLWTSQSLGQILDSPTVAKGFVYIGSQTSPSSNAGKLDVFSTGGCGQSECAPLWQGLVGTKSVLESSPAVAGGRVFIGGFDGKLYAFKATGCGSSTCLPEWTATTGGSIESTPTVIKGVVYVGSDDGNLYAFKAKGCNASSCTPLWTGSLGSAAFASSPAIANGIVYMVSQHALSAFKAGGCGSSTCAPLWQSSNSSDFFNGSAAVHKGRVFVPVEDGLDVYPAKGCGKATCAPLWDDFGSGRQAAIISSPTIANGVVYAGRNTSEVLAWSESCKSNQCTNIWSGATNDSIVSSSPAVVNGKVYIGSADDSFPSNIAGRLYVFGLTNR